MRTDPTRAEAGDDQRPDLDGHLDADLIASSGTVTRLDRTAGSLGDPMRDHDRITTEPAARVGDRNGCARGRVGSVLSPSRGQRVRPEVDDEHEDRGSERHDETDEQHGAAIVVPPAHRTPGSIVPTAERRTDVTNATPVGSVTVASTSVPGRPRAPLNRM